MLSYPFHLSGQQMAYGGATIESNTSKNEKVPKALPKAEKSYWLEVSNTSVFPVEPHTTTGNVLKIMASPSNNLPIVKQKWTDLQTGLASNYRLLNTDKAIMLIDATEATVGNVNLKYDCVDESGKEHTKVITIHIYGEDRGDLEGIEEAVHLVPLAPQIFLGKSINTELECPDAENRPQKNRYIDNNILFNDEDGIFQPMDIKKNEEATFYAEINNYSDELAHLTAFIDWNNDGLFNRSDEIISKTILPAPNVQYVAIDFQVPNTAKTNSKIKARFRLSTDRSAVMKPFGKAKDGEVEDYLIRVKNNH